MRDDFHSFCSKADPALRQKELKKRLRSESYCAKLWGFATHSGREVLLVHAGFTCAT